MEGREEKNKITENKKQLFESIKMIIKVLMFPMYILSSLLFLLIEKK
jgi:hypothetical protein